MRWMDGWIHRGQSNSSLCPGWVIKVYSFFLWSSRQNLVGLFHGGNAFTGPTTGPTTGQYPSSLKGSGGETHKNQPRTRGFVLSIPDCSLTHRGNMPIILHTDELQCATKWLEWTPSLTWGRMTTSERTNQPTYHVKITCKRRRRRREYQPSTDRPTM